jgi:hypothetical protein
MYRYIECIIWKATLATTHELLQAQNHETLDDIELLQPHPIVVDDALLEIHTTVISAVVCRSMSNYHGQTLPLSLNVVTSRCTFVLLGTSFSAYILMNTSQTAEKNFDTK